MNLFSSSLLWLISSFHNYTSSIMATPIIILHIYFIYLKFLELYLSLTKSTIIHYIYYSPICQDYKQVFIRIIKFSLILVSPFKSFFIMDLNSIHRLLILWISLLSFYCLFVIIKYHVDSLWVTFMSVFLSPNCG